MNAKSKKANSMSETNDQATNAPLFGEALNPKELRLALFNLDADVRADKKEQIEQGKYPFVQGNLEVGDRHGNVDPIRLQAAGYKVPGQEFYSLDIRQQVKTGVKDGADVWTTVRRLGGTFQKKGDSNKLFGYLREKSVTPVVVDGKTTYPESDWSVGFNAVYYPAVVEDGVIVKKAYIGGKEFWLGNGQKPGAPVSAADAEIDF